MRALQLAQKLIELALEHGNLEVRGSVDSTLYIERSGHKNKWTKTDITTVQAGNSDNPYIRAQKQIGEALLAAGRKMDEFKHNLMSRYLRPGVRVRYKGRGDLDVLGDCIGIVKRYDAADDEWLVSFGGHPWSCKADRLEVLPFVPQIENGSRVRVREIPPTLHFHKYSYRIGTVTKYTCDFGPSHNMYTVQFGTNWAYGYVEYAAFREDELEVLPWLNAASE